jgi:hypothetical protein
MVLVHAKDITVAWPTGSDDYKKLNSRLGMMVYTCNPSYLEGRSRRIAV